MIYSSFELFDPKAFITDSPPEEGCDHGDFSFAFNDSNFSNGVLRIYISPDSLDSVSEVKTLHISSTILSGRSRFFFKLFSKMRKLERHDATLRIKASEKAALMEVLKFMYCNILTVTTAPNVLDVLMAAYKYDVASCIRYCGRLLRNLTMTLECVLVYLDLPSTILTAEAFHSLTVAAKQFYAIRYKDITKFKDEILGLPLAGVEEIISSDDLRVTTENQVYDFVFRWARAQYPNIDDRREIMRTRLAKFIRYPYLTYNTILEILNYESGFDYAFALVVAGEALTFKSNVTHKLHTYISDDNSKIYHNFVQRVYEYRPIKWFESEEPHPHSVLCLDLKHDECASLYPSGYVRSEVFNSTGGQFFYLQAQCFMHKKSSVHRFVLLLLVRERKLYFVFDWEFAVRSKPTEEFVNKRKGRYICTGAKTVGYQKLFAIPWTSFIGEDSVYFIDDIVRFRVNISLRN